MIKILYAVTQTGTFCKYESASGRSHELDIQSEGPERLSVRLLSLTPIEREIEPYKSL